MLLLLAAFIACAVSQSTAGTTYANRSFYPLTVAQRPSAGVQPSDESYLVFTRTDANSGTTFLHSIGRTAALNSANDPPQNLLSHGVTDVVQGGGVSDYKISPDNSWVLFSSAVQQPGVFNHYSVGIGGGRITRITPPVFPPQLLSGVLRTVTWNWVPCQCGLRSDLLWGQFNTAFQSGNNFAPELWSVNRNGDYKRLSVALGQQQVNNAPTKLLTVTGSVGAGIGGQVDYDFIFYQANPGPDNADAATPGTSKAPRNHYIADWSGNNWQISPATTAALAGNSLGSFVRSQTCGGPGRYVMIADKVNAANVDSVFIYDLVNKRAAGTSAAAGSLPSVVSPTGVGSCVVMGFSPDETVGFFTCAVSPTDTNQDLYVINLSTLATTKITAAYAAANLTPAPAGRIHSVTLAGDFIVWAQGLAATPAVLVSLFSYNWKTNPGTANTLFTGTATLAFTTPPTNPTFAFADAESSSSPAATVFFNVQGPTGSLGSSLTVAAVTNTAYVWFQVTDNSAGSKTQYYFAAVNGGTAKAIADTTGADSLQTRLCRAPTGGACDLTSTSCQSCTCGSQPCSGWVYFVGTVSGSAATTQIYSAKYDGTGLVTTSVPSTACGGSQTLPIIWQGSVGHPFTNPLRPLIYFTATTGNVGAEAQNLWVVQAGSATPLQLGPSGIVAKGGVVAGGAQVCNGPGTSTSPVSVATWQVAPALSPDGKWLVLQAQTSSSTTSETYLVIADGSAAARKVSPTPDASHTSGGVPVSVPNPAGPPGPPRIAGLPWTPDSKYAFFVWKDITTPMPAGRLRDQLWSVQADTSAIPLVYNLTVQSPLAVQTDFNPINAITSWDFHCNSKTVIYTTKFPEIASPAQVYSVPVTGGKTTLLSFDPARGVSASVFGVLKSQFAVVFRGSYYDTGGNDFFWNTASQSMLTPAIALLALLLALFVQ